MKNILRRLSLLVKGIFLFKDWDLWLMNRFGFPRRTGVGTFRFRNGVTFAIDFSKQNVGVFQEVWLMDLYEKWYEIKKGDVVVDIGAHIGAFSVLAAKKGAHVYAFEPMPISFRFLTENIKNYDVRAANLAVYDKSGKLTIFESKGGSEGASVFPPATSGPVERVTAEATTLEQIFLKNKIERCDFLKMDCEKSEVHILKSTPKEIFKKIKNIAIEYHNNYDEVRRILIANGFEILESSGGKFGYCYAKRSAEEISAQPLVSIGLPVYNGMPYVKKTIDSVLGQTYKNIELVITDNPSTDNTQTLCEEYARKDKRVRYIRHKENIGAIANYNSAFTESKGEYFCWVSYDDYLDPRFVEKCVALLSGDKKAVVAMADFVFVNGKGETIFKANPKDFVVREKDLYPRLKQYILMGWASSKVMAIHGLWRRDAIVHDEYRDLPDGDINFVFRGLSRGPFLFVPEVLFYKGVLPGGESRLGEPLTSSRVFSAVITRIKLIQPHLLNMKYVLGFSRLSYAERLKLIFWELFTVAKMFTRRSF